MYTTYEFKATVLDLEAVMQDIRDRESRGKGAPVSHILYRRYRDAILDNAREQAQQDRQARKSQYPTLPPLAWGKEKS